MPMEGKVIYILPAGTLAPNIPSPTRWGAQGNVQQVLSKKH